MNYSPFQRAIKFMNVAAFDIMVTNQQTTPLYDINRLIKYGKTNYKGSYILGNSDRKGWGGGGREQKKK